MQRKMKYLKLCPFCGAELNGKERENDLLAEMYELKEKGILEQTMFIAVKVIHSMSDRNPVWLKEALDKQTDKLKDSIQRKLSEETRVVLKSIMEIKGSPVTMGKMQEESIAKRLSSLKTGEDRFRTEKSRRAQEDVECLVIEDGIEIGKILVESKRTKMWREAYVDQLKGYMERENTEFGILASCAMPDDVLNNTSWRDGVLIVNVDDIEPAYIFFREYLKLKRDLEQQYSARIDQLGVRDQILEELKQAISSGELDSIIDRIKKATLDIEDMLGKAENYLSRVFRTIRKDTNKIRQQAEELARQHIEKIRTQLIQQPSPSFS